MFSTRVPSSLETNPMARALQAAKAASIPLIDLTVTNPTQAAFVYPDTLLAPLDAAEALVYEPSPFGVRRARQAVADDYARRGIEVSPDRVVLTPSTSDAYSLLFKLLCEPAGDEVLTPAPSYPLFEHLTRLDGVTPVHYALEYQGRWVLGLESIDRAWTPQTRAVLAVSPNNPTGSCLSAEELRALSGLCAAQDAALILDEVFADYPLVPVADGQRPAAGPSNHPCLTFRLGGLSKSAGLPQVKLGWMAVEGPDDLVAAALDRLEFICDAYLSVSMPVQIAAHTLLSDGAFVRHQIAARVQGNAAMLRQLIAGAPSIELLAADAGWSAVLRVPARKSEEQLVLELLERDGVIVHPGYFFDFRSEAFLVLSLLPPAPIFEDGVSRILRRLA